MTISSVLVPGSGAPAGINTIKSLKAGGFGGKIIATDSDIHSVGFFLTSSFSILPRIEESEKYLTSLKNVIKNNNVEALLPSSGFDIFPFSKFRKELMELGAYPVVSDPDVLISCSDKIKTWEKLNKKFDLPFTTNNPEEISEFPIFSKPRLGKGSRNCFLINNKKEFDFVREKYDDLLFQEVLPGIEYTVDVLSDLEKKPIIAVPRIRLETKEGISTKGRIIRNPSLEKTCMEISQELGIRGPCCIQMKESKNGNLKLVEVNPRMGGGTIFASLAGANFPMMILDLIEQKKIAIPEINEITVLRYYEEIIEQ